MVKLHNLGFPRIGAKRELKFALESYWKGKISLDNLKKAAAGLRKKHWQDQAKLDLIPIGDFSLYDQVLDMSFTLGNLPARARDFDGDPIDNYFRVARGRSAPIEEGHEQCCGIAAGEMTKWFDTNYHYIVPEFDSSTSFKLEPSRLLDQLAEADFPKNKLKPVIIGPVTYLALGKTKNDSNKLELLSKLLPVYRELLDQLADQKIEWVQIDEPILVTELDDSWKNAFEEAYRFLSEAKPKLLLTTYFGKLVENLSWTAALPVDGFHLDAMHAREEIESFIEKLPEDRIISLGVVDGRNIWKTDLQKTLNWLEPIAQKLKNRLWLAPSCSLLHVPVDLNSEQKLDPEIRSWLAFAEQKLEELQILGAALNDGRKTVQSELDANQKAIQSRKNSPRVTNPDVQAKVKQISPGLGQQKSPYSKRSKIQEKILDLPKFPTTTIGSFPQTPEIRRTRNQFRQGKLDLPTYQKAMKQEIARCIEEQEKIGLDVLVHGEPERNDMVEYFGEQLEGYAFTEFGWVQSYGSRCVKPPILFGDIRRPKPMSIDWILHAQSLTEKPVKGMLTGPVTILNWSFVRDDQPLSVSCQQLALAIREEVLDLEKADVRVIQVDEAALREGLPLRKSEWKNYLEWAIESFRITANGVSDQTQIHTHMCYSNFNDIIESIAKMDADVITIETSRSDMELLDAFDEFDYPNEIGPGVYDIHSPNIPNQESMVSLIRKAAERIPADRLWINPDCGLKTRRWEEVRPALKNLVEAAEVLREQFSPETSQI